MTLVDVFTLLGAVVVLPWAVLAVPRWIWSVCVFAAAAGLSLPEGGGAAVAASPWLVVSAVAAANAARERIRHRVWGLDDLVAVGAPAFAATAGAALVQTCLGVPVFGIHEPIVQLTAVHFTFAGAGGLALAGVVRRHALGRPRSLAGAAIVLTAVAPPIVAIGFLTHAPFPQVGGAIAMTAGVWCTAAAQLGVLKRQRAVVRGLAVASSAAVGLAMPFGVAWAAAQHWGSVPALSIPDMVRTHGMLNGVLFIPCGLLAWRLAERDLRGAGGTST